MQNDQDLDEASLAALVTHFYAQVRQDALLGPLFNVAIADWQEHQRKLAAFWSSVILTTGRYKGQPLPAHLRHQAQITPDMFARWLAHWEESAAQCLPPQHAAAVVAKAQRIASSLRMVLFPTLPPRAGDPTPASTSARL
jgi:hemoglobin